MQREMKFRVWIPEKQTMIYDKPFVLGTRIEKDDLFILLDGIVCWAPYAGSIDKVANDYKLMQFTGLHDKNGKEIYESDLLKITFKRYRPIEEWNTVTTVVFWNDECVCWDKETLGMYEYDEVDAAGGSPFEFDETTTFEIIGNIYENPELLEEK